MVCNSLIVILKGLWLDKLWSPFFIITTFFLALLKTFNTNLEKLTGTTSSFWPWIIVTSIFDFNNEEEAIKIANSTNYGLASGVFTSDDQKAKWTAERIQAGIIWHNDWFVDGVNLPGGGYKKSGYGRDGGIDGVYSHGQTKRISKRLNKM